MRINIFCDPGKVAGKYVIRGGIKKQRSMVVRMKINRKYGVTNPILNIRLMEYDFIHVSVYCLLFLLTRYRF